MRHPHEKTPHTFLSTSGVTLPKLYRKAQILLRLQSYLTSHLGAPISDHCRVANWRDGCLIIQVDSAAWALHVRYTTPDLLEKLRKIPELRALRTIQHYVQPAMNAHNTTPSESEIKLSQENARLLRDLANTIPHQNLANALKRLANRG